MTLPLRAGDHQHEDGQDHHQGARRDRRSEHHERSQYERCLYPYRKRSKPRMFVAQYFESPLLLWMLGLVANKRKVRLLQRYSPNLRERAF
jgi:hypothetical protein